MQESSIERFDRHMATGNVEGARQELAALESGADPSSSAKFSIAQMSIDLADATGDQDLACRGLALLRAMRDAGDRKIVGKIQFWYSLGNGMSTVLKLKSKHGSLYLVDQPEAREGKAAYRKALALMRRKKLKIPEIWVNYGNFLRIQLGRLLEGIECYRSALSMDPKHAMANANMGAAKLQFCKVVSGNARGVLLTEAYYHVEDALSIGLDNLPGQYFESTRQVILKHFRKHPDRRFTTCDKRLNPDVTEFRRFFRSFCHRERLFLNPLGPNHQCPDAISDPLTLQQMKTTNHDAGAFLRFAGYVNQLKQEYVFCRYLAAQAAFRDKHLGFLDEGVTILDTLDGSAHNIYVEHARSAYRMTWSILDKIAGAVNEYLKLGVDPERLHFRHLSPVSGAREVRQALPTTNPYFAALAAMAYEADAGDLKPDRDLRNAMEHRYKFVHHEDALPRSFSFDSSARTLEEDLLKTADFFNQLLRLLRIAKASITYLILLIDHNERFLHGPVDRQPGAAFVARTRTVEEKHRA